MYVCKKYITKHINEKFFNFLRERLRELPFPYDPMLFKGTSVSLKGVGFVNRGVGFVNKRSWVRK